MKSVAAPRNDRIGKVVYAMVKSPYGHGKPGLSSDGKPHRPHFGEWLRREDAGVEGSASSFFVRRHDEHVPPGRTCIQGHEIAPGEAQCSHGHPVG